MTSHSTMAPMAVRRSAVCWKRPGKRRSSPREFPSNSYSPPELSMDEKTRKEMAIRLFEEAHRKQMGRELDEAVELYRKSIDSFPTAEAYTFLSWTYSF